MVWAQSTSALPGVLHPGRFHSSSLASSPAGVLCEPKSELQQRPGPGGTLVKEQECCKKHRRQMLQKPTLHSTHLHHLLTCDNRCCPCRMLGHGHDEWRTFFCSSPQGVCKEDDQLLSADSRGAGVSGLPRGCWSCQSRVDAGHAPVDPPHHRVRCNAAQWWLGETKCLKKPGDRKDLYTK